MFERSAVRRRHRLLFVASTGGHLAQLVQLSSWWEQHQRTWVTFDKTDARSVLDGEHVIHAHHPTTRHLGNATRNAVLAHAVLADVRPDAVISTGAGVALPFFVLARARRIPTLYLEVYDRVDSTTLTGRLCRPFSTAFCVQWPEQLPLYPGSERTGMVL